jgi:hypothetical protein
VPGSVAIYESVITVILMIALLYFLMTVLPEKRQYAGVGRTYKV